MQELLLIDCSSGFFSNPAFSFRKRFEPLHLGRARGGIDFDKAEFLFVSLEKLDRQELNPAFREKLFQSPSW